ncbi:hypothetical protein LIP_2828 [Limnochorda pilosa]|uniref:Uncharacterized protein n=2 Tax=Limnochorda pilosa TaxID=1555112 RepID=A0A0K2SNU2_LIMPI|nr:hypothetical protein LIP_2828 [Limnochorda pilosa]
MAVVSVMTFINLRDYAGDGGAPTEGPVGRFAEYLGRIVAAGLAYPAGPTIPTAIRCRRRPGHRRCSGYLDVTRLDIPREIRWQCPECGDQGVIRDWQGTPWDRRFPQHPLPEEASFWLVVDDEEIQALARLIPDMAREGARMVAAGLRTPEGITLAGDVEAFMAVADAIRLALLDGSSSATRRLLVGLLERLAMVVADSDWS